MTSKWLMKKNQNVEPDYQVGYVSDVYLDSATKEAYAATESLWSAMTAGASAVKE